MIKNHLLLCVPCQLLSVISPHPPVPTSLPRSVSPSVSPWALSSDGFWPTFGCSEFQCVWAKSQRGFTGRASEKWRDRGSERRRLSEKIHVEWDRDSVFCCRYTLLCRCVFVPTVVGNIFYRFSHAHKRHVKQMTLLIPLVKLTMIITLMVYIQWAAHMHSSWGSFWCENCWDWASEQPHLN